MPINDFFSKCDQVRSFLRFWSHLLKKFLMENFIFCAVRTSGTNISQTIKAPDLFDFFDDKINLMRNRPLILILKFFSYKVTHGIYLIKRLRSIY